MKIDTEGRIVGPSDYPVNATGFALHAAVHLARPDAVCVMHLHNMAGIAVSKKRELAAALTETTCKVLGVEPQSVDIIFTDVKPENWATGGKLSSEPR